MAEMRNTHKNVLLDLIMDFEDFIDKLEDPKFMASIKKGIREAESGDTVKCKDSQDLKKLFESL